MERFEARKFSKGFKKRSTEFRVRVNRAEKLAKENLSTTRGRLLLRRRLLPEIPKVGLRFLVWPCSSPTMTAQPVRLAAGKSGWPLFVALYSRRLIAGGRPPFVRFFVLSVFMVGEHVNIKGLEARTASGLSD